MNYLANLKDFAKKQLAVFLINLVLATLFGLLLAKLGGKYSREFEALLKESLAFKSILVVLPMELFVCGIVLALLAIPCLRSSGGPWFQKYVLQPFAEFGAGLSVVAVAIIWGVAIAAAITDSQAVAIGLLANSLLLVVMVLIVLAVPYVTSPSALGANTAKALLGWSLFLLLGSGFLLSYSYRFEEDECAKCHQMANTPLQRDAPQAARP